ncbi:MAG: hypothetical protein IKZ59_03335 [Clostridia bacterium]|nr:hypothetical protein [Clostridia bacterium]
MLKIGWSKQDISTDKPFPLGGQAYIRFSRFVLDPIYVTALTVENGGNHIIFLSTDVSDIPGSVLNSVKTEVSRINADINPLNIIINATHCHSAPMLSPGDTVGEYGKFSELPHDGVPLSRPGEYFDFFVSRCAKAILDSFNSRSEGYISYGYGFATTSHNRRAVYFKDMTEDSDNKLLKLTEGSAKMYGRTDIPEFSHLESGADPYVNFMFTFGADKKLTGAVINVPSPSQNIELEYSISADFWHDVRVGLAERYGDIYILPQCGAAGDLAPRARYYDKAEERRFRLKYADVKLHDGLVNPTEIFRRKDIAEQIIAAFDDVYPWAKKEKLSDVPVLHTVKEIGLEKRCITQEEYDYFDSARLDYEDKPPISTDDKVYDLKRNTRNISAKYDNETIVKRYKEQYNSESFITEIHTVRIGDIAFASNQFELYMDFAHRIAARSPFVQTFIIELAAQPGRPSGSYIATERAVKCRGYSANLFSNYVTPNGGTKLVEATLDELNNLYK